MIEINASFRSVEASVTSYQATSQRDALTVKIGSNRDKPSLLNKQEKQIIDDVAISNDAVKQLESARAVSEKLSAYLDYLKGRNDNNQVRLTARNNDPAVTIQGRSTNIAASVTVASYREETLDINAKFDDAGNLQELSINKTTITAEYVQADLIVQDHQFYASI